MFASYRIFVLSSIIGFRSEVPGYLNVTLSPNLRAAGLSFAGVRFRTLRGDFTIFALAIEDTSKIIITIPPLTFAHLTPDVSSNMSYLAGPGEAEMTDGPDSLSFECGKTAHVTSPFTVSCPSPALIADVSFAAIGPLPFGKEECGLFSWGRCVRSLTPQISTLCLGRASCTFTPHLLDLEPLICPLIQDEDVFRVQWVCKIPGGNMKRFE